MPLSKPNSFDPHERVSKLIFSNIMPPNQPPPTRYGQWVIRKSGCRQPKMHRLNVTDKLQSHNRCVVFLLRCIEDINASTTSYPNPWENVPNWISVSSFLNRLATTITWKQVQLQVRGKLYIITSCFNKFNIAVVKEVPVWFMNSGGVCQVPLQEVTHWRSGETPLISRQHVGIYIA